MPDRPDIPDIRSVGLAHLKEILEKMLIEEGQKMLKAFIHCMASKQSEDFLK